MEQTPTREEFALVAKIAASQIPLADTKNKRSEKLTQQLTDAVFRIGVWLAHLCKLEKNPVAATLEAIEVAEELSPRTRAMVCLGTCHLDDATILSMFSEDGLIKPYITFGSAMHKFVVEIELNEKFQHDDTEAAPKLASDLHHIFSVCARRGYSWILFNDDTPPVDWLALSINSNALENAS